MIIKTPSGQTDAFPDEKSRETERPGKIYFDYGINVPTIIAFIVMLGAGVGWLLNLEHRQTASELNIKNEAEIRTITDKGIIDHASAMEQVSTQQRLEMRDDLKEIKQILIKQRR